MKTKNKPSFLLLEVLIAFALLALCVFPLIAPHVYLLNSQTTFIRKVELDHLVNLLNGHITEQLYFNKIPWESIEQSTRFPIDDTLKSQIDFPFPTNFTGTYFFTERARKPKKSDEKPDPPYILYILILNLTFSPPQKNAKELVYTYDIFVARNLIGTAPVQE